MSFKKEETSPEQAQKEAETIGEYAKDARNRKEARMIADKLESAIEDQKDEEIHMVRDMTTLVSTSKRQEQVIEKILDETKDNIRKTLTGTRKEIPRCIEAVKGFQEQAIQTTIEIVDNYTEFQKWIANSIHVWIPYSEDGYETFWSNWIAPRRMTKLYANLGSNFLDNIVTANRFATNMMFVNMEAIRSSMQLAQKNTKELFSIGANATKQFEHIAKNTILGQRFFIMDNPNYYGISMVHNDKNHDHITLVKQHRISGNQVLDDGTNVERSLVISNLLKGIPYVTIISNNRNWEKGADVHIIQDNGSHFIRTDGNSYAGDNLENLPEF